MLLLQMIRCDCRRQVVSTALNREGGEERGRKRCGSTLTLKQWIVPQTYHMSKIPRPEKSLTLLNFLWLQRLKSTAPNQVQRSLFSSKSDPETGCRGGSHRCVRASPSPIALRPSVQNNAVLRTVVWSPEHFSTLALGI